MARFRGRKPAVPLSIAGAAVLGLGALSADVLGQASFGSQTDVSYADALWQALADVRLVGQNAIGSYPYEGTEPHGAVLQTLKTQLNVEGQEGQVIVKRNFGPAGITLSEVWSDPDQHLAAVTVMFKREAGYDSQNQDWFWAKYNPDGTLDQTAEGMALAGKVAGCIDCHQSAAGGDYVYTNDR